MTYRCGACGLAFAEREWAEKCNAWCVRHRSCNLEIIKHALPSRSPPG